MTTTKSPLDPLLALGLTDIEGRVYLYLLQNEPATGYRISHAIDKPTANTYKAIASLAQRGAVLLDDTETRLVRAVPPAELLAQMEQQFSRHQAEATTLLEGLAAETTDDRVYTLGTVDQVLERARAMLSRAEQIAVLDIFPGILTRLEPDLRETGSRGVRVVAKIYREARIPGVTTILDGHAPEILELWPGQQLTLVVDALEHLIALCDRTLDRVYQGIWSNSTFLSCMHHNHVTAEIGYTRNRDLIEARGLEMDGTERISLLASNAPGLRALRDRFLA